MTANNIEYLIGISDSMAQRSLLPDTLGHAFRHEVALKFLKKDPAVMQKQSRLLTESLTPGETN